MDSKMAYKDGSNCPLDLILARYGLNIASLNLSPFDVRWYFDRLSEARLTNPTNIRPVMKETASAIYYISCELSKTTGNTK